jgi:hypothetical protein
MKRYLPLTLLPLLLGAMTFMGGCSSSQNTAGKLAPVTNGDLETGARALWAPYLSVRASVGSTAVDGGKFSLAAVGGNGSVYQDVHGLQSGVANKVSTWVSGSPGATASAQIAVWDPGTNVATSSNAVTPDATWQPVKHDFTASASGTIRLHSSRGDGTGTVYWDDVSLSRSE